MGHEHSHGDVGHHHGSSGHDRGTPPPGRAGGWRRNLLSHTGVVGLAGLVVGLVLLLCVPSLEVVSRSVLLFSGFHIVGGIVLLASLYAVALRHLFRHAIGGSPRAGGEESLRFGWGPEWMNGLAIAALVAGSIAVAIEIGAPDWWPLALVLALLAGFFLIGNFVMRSFRSRAHVVLPMVDLLRTERDLVLDAGCGAGRTTIALGRVLGEGQVVAVDRFDADYIDDGGRELLERNLRVAGMSGQVRIETADLTALPFADATFDSVVSTNVFDHLGRGKARGLAETFRVLKPGGRFLMAVWVPGWEMFTVGSFLSWFMTSKGGWRRMAKASGFEIVDEGAFNYAWFALLQKPGAART